MDTAMAEAPGSKLGKKHLIESTVDLAAGSIGGMACVYVGQPLDTVKVKMQTFPGMYRNSTHCFVQTYKESGILRGLYAGTVPSLVANVAENAILFVAYGLCQKTISGLVGAKSYKDLNVFQNAMAGSCASFFSALVLTPTELIKCKLQAMKEMQTSGKLTGPFSNVKNIRASHLIKHIIKEEGVSGLSRGLQATILREMPGYFFFFGGYEACRTLLTPSGKTKDDLSPLRLLLCGGMGGICFWVSVYPADVVKSRVQIQSDNGTSKKMSYSATLFKIYKQEGLPALYNGLGPTIIRTFFATAALFLAYENSKKFLTKATLGGTRHSSH